MSYQLGFCSRSADLRLHDSPLPGFGGGVCFAHLTGEPKESHWFSVFLAFSCEALGLTSQLFTYWSRNKFTLNSILIYLIVYFIDLLGHFILGKPKTDLWIPTTTPWLRLETRVIPDSSFSSPHNSTHLHMLSLHPACILQFLSYFLFYMFLFLTSNIYKICLKCKALPIIPLLKPLNVCRKHSFMLFKEENCQIFYLPKLGIELMGLNREIIHLIVGYEQH